MMRVHTRIKSIRMLSFADTIEPPTRRERVRTRMCGGERKGGEEGRRRGGEEERRRGEVEKTDKGERRGEERACDVVCLEDEIPPRQNSIRGKGAIRISHIGARALIRIESNRG